MTAKILSVAALLALLAGQALAQHPHVIPGVCLPEDEIVNVSLNDVRAKPEAYLASTVRFEARFHRVGDVYQPFFTVFDASEFANFSAWDITNDLSTESGYMDNCPLLYVQRNSVKPIEELFRLQSFEAFIAVGVVRSVFDGKAFIEVTEVHRCHPAPCDPTCKSLAGATAQHGDADKAATAAANPTVETTTASTSHDAVHADCAAACAGGTCADASADAETAATETAGTASAATQDAATAKPASDGSR